MYACGCVMVAAARCLLACGIMCVAFTSGRMRDDGNTLDHSLVDPGVTVYPVVERQLWSGETSASFTTAYYLARRAVILTNVPQLTTVGRVFGQVPSGHRVVYERRSPSDVTYKVEYSDGSWEEFLRELVSDAADVYLTVQRADEESTTWDTVLGADLFTGPNSFTRHLEGRNVFSYNLWCGRQAVGASNATATPLHYDYHDNLYYVVQGRKEFRLLPPDAHVPTNARHCAEHGISEKTCHDLFGPPHFSRLNTADLESAEGIVAQRITLSAGVSALIQCACRGGPLPLVQPICPTPCACTCTHPVCLHRMFSVCALDHVC
jgi:hypothetical protein